MSVINGGYADTLGVRQNLTAAATCMLYYQMHMIYPWELSKVLEIIGCVQVESHL